MDPKLRAILRRERRLKIATVAMLLVGGGVILFSVDNLLLSVVLAFVIKYLMAPIVDFLERRHFPRQFAILIPFVFVGGAIGLGIFRLLPVVTDQIAKFETHLPRYQLDLLNLVTMLESRFQVVSKLYNVSFSQTINSWIIAKTSLVSSALPAVVGSSLTVSMLAPFFAFFMLQDGRQVSRTLLSLVPNNLFELGLNLSHQLNEQFGGFIRARFLEAAIVGLVVFVGLSLVSFPYAHLLGLFAGLANLIPYIGPIVGAAPALLLVLLSDTPLITSSVGFDLVVISSTYFMAQLIDIVFIIPLVVARIVNLHPVTVIVVIILGAQVMGVLGMVISIPVASAIKLVFSAVYDHLLELRT